MTKFAFLLKKIGNAIKEQMTPISKRSYLGKPPDNKAMETTWHESGKRVNWLAKGSRITTYTDMGNVGPLSEKAIRTLTSG